jgi:hypothetical protein
MNRIRPPLWSAAVALAMVAFAASACGTSESCQSGCQDTTTSSSGGAAARGSCDAYCNQCGGGVSDCHGWCAMQSGCDEVEAQLFACLTANGCDVNACSSQGDAYSACRSKTSGAGPGPGPSSGGVGGAATTGSGAGAGSASSSGSGVGGAMTGCYGPGNGEMVCIIDWGLSPSMKDGYDAGCKNDGGQVVTHCPAAGVVGCCTVDYSGGMREESCEYGGSAQTIESDCAAAHGMFSTSP